MSLQKLEVIVEHPDPVLTFRFVSSVIEKMRKILEGVDRKLSEDCTQSASWGISDIGMHSPLHMTCAPAPIRSDRSVRNIIDPFLDDMNRLEEGKRPLVFTPELQRIAKELLLTIGTANARIRFSGDGKRAEPSARLIASVDELSHPHTEVGSIEGRLDVIDVHGREQVRVWDSRFDIPVVCRISSNQIEKAKDYLRSRVVIRGMVRYENQKPTMVQEVFEIRQLGDRSKLPQAEDISPVDITEGEDPADYLRGDEE